MEYIYAVRTENEMAALRIFANNYSAVVDKYIYPIWKRSLMLRIFPDLLC
jgi:hypothetical protein